MVNLENSLLELLSECFKITLVHIALVNVYMAQIVFSRERCNNNLSSGMLFYSVTMPLLLHDMESSFPGLGTNTKMTCEFRG